jgi:tRNA-specific adenosine deaminase 1
MEAPKFSARQAEAERAFADAITQAVHSKYESLPQRGKPLKQEWTVLAGIVATTHDLDAAARGDEQDLSKVAGTARVVALATGTKCLGPSRMSEQGWVIHDCHAEVLCRRALVHCILNWLDSGGGGSEDGGDESLAWLLEKLPPSSVEGGASGGGLTKRVRLKPGVQLHLYISDSPCGDGALVGEYVPRHAQPKDAQVAEVAAGDGDKQPGQMMPSVSPQGDTPESIVDQAAPAPKRARVGRITGAKPAAAYGADVVAKDKDVVADDQPSHTSGASSSSATRASKQREENRHQQAVGALRTKSGRSDLSEQDRTMCMSCSDKILLWNLVGMQGALLAGVMDGPLLLSSVIVGADALWPDLTRTHVTEVVSRAVFGRLGAADAGKRYVCVCVFVVSVFFFCLDV